MVLPEEMVGTHNAADQPPVTPRDAATVMVVRDGTAGLEVFLLRRVVGMAFAGGMTVFPGGGVDPRDMDGTDAWAGPPPSWWAERLGAPEQLATALVCAAVRETFEECGVLLAGIGPDRVIGDVTGFTLARRAVERRDLSLAGFLDQAGLVLRADLLRPWANWVTPEAEPRRYDTRFFLAELPEGQWPDGATSEADRSGWRRPAEAIDDWRAGRSGLLPPTWTTLAELAEFDTVASAMAATRTIDKVVPKVIREGSVLRVVLPGDPRWETASTHLDAGPGDELAHP
ncbi:MAG TPA: NUDIX hydrolase [Pseudonocardiaceae bacterium]|nr:NUDIX hydrolase [Pseudonocardiaceae bacterium]